MYTEELNRRIARKNAPTQLLGSKKAHITLTSARGEQMRNSSRIHLAIFGCHR
jgi:hypothetical protein